MKRAKDFRAMAREALSGHWLSAVLAGVIAAILGGGIIYGGSSGGSSSSAGSTAATGSEAALENAVMSLESAAPGLVTILLTVLSIAAVVLLFIALITLIIGGPVSLGYAKYNLSLVDGKPAHVEDLFSQFNRFGDGFLLRLLTGIFVILWTLLLVIPGIIAAFSYSMAPYILYENPGMSANEALKASKQLMKGNKWRLFCLEFSFIGWSILAALTLGIGGLFLRPYVETAGAAFYREIKAEAAGAQNPIYGEYTVA